MSRNRVLPTWIARILVGAALALASATGASAADKYPSQPIHVIVTSAAGGWMDVEMRFVAQYMSKTLGQTIVIENRAGGGGLISLRYVKNAKPDGYTLLCAVNTAAIQQFVNADPGYDLTKDFSGVGALERAPYLLMVSGHGPDKSFANFVARAKATPGKLTFGSSGVGGTTQIATATFLQRFRLDMQHVPYKGNSAAWPDVISNRVNMIFEPYGTGAGMVHEGLLRVLAVTSDKRLDTLPDVPTMAEMGAPGYNFYLWLGLFAPTGTPSDVVQKLSTALRTALATPEVREHFHAQGSEATPMAPEDFNRFVQGQSAAMGKLVAGLHIPKE